jgi:DNA mismatch repair protein MutS
MFKINRNTHSLLKKSSSISNPLPNLLNKIYSSTLNIYSNKGKILCDFRKLRNNKTLLRDIILYTAEIDAYCSIVKLYKKHQYTKCHLCLPDYIVSPTPKIDIKDVWNPILNPNKAISNSIKLTKNIIITGPNMGGKSTFIKSLMLSILFSQTLTISFCKTQSFTPFSYIQTYLNIPDCKGKESLFEAEMNRAYKYISYIEKLEQDSSLFSFIIMDEIFSSTNPREGLSGAYAIADKLGNYKNNISMITTHYSELSLLEKYGKYKNYKIPIDRDISNNIVYPYKIKRGISQQYIALELLRDKGFDKDIINVANDICKKLEPKSTKVQNNKSN